MLWYLECWVRERVRGNQSSSRTRVAYIKIRYLKRVCKIADDQTLENACASLVVWLRAHGSTIRARCTD